MHKAVYAILFWVDMPVAAEHCMATSITNNASSDYLQFALVVLVGASGGVLAMLLLFCVATESTLMSFRPHKSSSLTSRGRLSLMLRVSSGRAVPMQLMHHMQTGADRSQAPGSPEPKNSSCKRQTFPACIVASNGGIATGDAADESRKKKSGSVSRLTRSSF